MSFIPFPEFKAQTYITVKQNTYFTYGQVSSRKKKVFHLHFKRQIYDFRNYFILKFLYA